MKNKSYKEHLKEENSRIEKDMNNLEKTLGLNKGSGTIINDLITLPLKVAGEVYTKIMYLGANIVKHPAVLTKYILQKN